MKKKAKDTQQKPKSRKLLWGGVFLAVAAAVIVLIAYLQKPRQSPENLVQEDFAETPIIDLNKLVKTVPDKPVFPDYIPVVMYRDGTFKGMGTLLTKRNIIVTCQHLFRSGSEGVWEFYEINKEKNKEQISGGYINTVQGFEDGSVNPDLVVCKYGPEKVIVKGFYGIRDRHVISQIVFCPKDKRETAVSVIDGSLAEIIGVIPDPEGNRPVFIIKFHGGRGLSGSGFIWRDMLLVLNAGMKGIKSNVPPDVQDSRDSMVQVIPFHKVDLKIEK